MKVRGGIESTEVVDQPFDISAEGFKPVDAKFKAATPGHKKGEEYAATKQDGDPTLEAAEQQEIHQLTMSKKTKKKADSASLTPAKHDTMKAEANEKASKQGGPACQVSDTALNQTFKSSKKPNKYKNKKNKASSGNKTDGETANADKAVSNGDNFKKED